MGSFQFKVGWFKIKAGTNLGSQNYTYLSAPGEHFEFLRMVHDHNDEMASVEEELKKTEKELAGGTGEEDDIFLNVPANLLDPDTGDVKEEERQRNEDDENELDIELPGDFPLATLKEKKRLFKREDRLFCQLYCTTSCAVKCGNARIMAT